MNTFWTAAEPFFYAVLVVVLVLVVLLVLALIFKKSELVQRMETRARNWRERRRTGTPTPIDPNDPYATIPPNPRVRQPVRQRGASEPSRVPWAAVLVLLTVFVVIMGIIGYLGSDETDPTIAAGDSQIIAVPVGEWTKVYDISKRPCLGIPDRKLKARGDGKFEIDLDQDNVPTTVWKTVEYKSEVTPGKVTLRCD
mgnify:CR=1 FL=1